jgi:5-methylcytosine-specific restriction endonuclease McrA
MNKTCASCNRVLDIGLFTKDSSKEDGYSYKCRACQRVYRQSRGLVKSDGWERKTEDMSAYLRAWRQANKDRLKEYSKRHKRTPEQERVRWVKRMIKEKGPDWKPKQLMSQEEKLARRRESYRKANEKRKLLKPEDVKLAGKVKRAKRRARKAGSGGSFTKKQVLELLVKQKYLCISCRTSIKKKYHADHVVPLALGGSNMIENIQLLCPPCNLTKAAKNPVDFMQSKGYLL